MPIEIYKYECENHKNFFSESELCDYCDPISGNTGYIWKNCYWCTHGKNKYIMSNQFIDLPIKCYWKANFLAYKKLLDFIGNYKPESK